MAKFLYHEACDICGSRDNKAVYDDGSTFCFGCRTATSQVINLHKVFHPENISKESIRQFPWDVQESMPIEPLKWLLQYEITNLERDKFGIYWSPARQMLCWQIKSPRDEILGWQGRNFNPNAKTKYTSYGEIRSDLCILGTDQTKQTVVLVEDYISAIKVSKHLPCIPLFGCTISTKGLQAIKDRFKGVIVWLDSDKLENARKIALQAPMSGLIGQVLFTELDPKSYKTNDIKNFLQALNSEV